MRRGCSRLLAVLGQKGCEAAILQKKVPKHQKQEGYRKSYWNKQKRDSADLGHRLDSLSRIPDSGRIFAVRLECGTLLL
jgi:hypothetical protein